jgi:CspA family cold shock protein
MNTQAVSSPADQWITCKTCKTEFLFSEREAAFFAKKRITPPKNCKNCRTARKARDVEAEALAEKELAAGKKQTGIIEKYDPERGFGFLMPDGGGDSTFFHIRDIFQTRPKQIVVGAEVEFVEVPSVRQPGRTCAARVRVLLAESGNGAKP